MTTFDRPRGTMVKELDRTALTALLKSKYPSLEASAEADRNALVWASGRGYAVLHTEGVGYFANDDGTYSVSVWFNGVSHGWLDLTLEEIQGVPFTEVDLADYVRNHNDRLQGNFYEWKSVIKGGVWA